MILKSPQEKNLQILLIGYNRPEKIQDRLKELKKLRPQSLFVSIDWKSEAQRREFLGILDAESKAWPIELTFEYRVLERNLGNAEHLVESISQVLTNYESIIVIEDDIEVSESFITYASKELANPSFSSKYASVGGFSVLSLPKALQRLNRFRESIYFYCWGWGTTREIWEKYVFDFSRENLMMKLDDSAAWNTLSRDQKETWLRRFRKVQENPRRTWDIQFQYMSFVWNLKHLNPIGRLVENNGFSDIRSTNTINHRPWWLGRYRYGAILHEVDRAPKSINKIFHLMDGITLIGDAQKISKFLKKFLLRES